MNFIKFIRIFLLVLIVIGIGLLITQKMWVPKVVDLLLLIEGNKKIVESETQTLLENQKDEPYVKYNFFKEQENFWANRANEYFPSEMADYLIKYRYCTHWSGEEGYDEQRSNDIQKGVEENCIDFEVAKKEIKEKYPNHEKLSVFLKSEKEIYEGGDNFFLLDDPQNKSSVLNRYFESMAQWTIESVDSQMKEYDGLITANNNSEGLNDIKFRLGVQKTHIDQLLPQLNRLHPATKKAIEDIRDNKDFQARSSQTTQ